MPVGRPPKPTAIRILDGNPGKRAINRNEPKFSGIPKCPSTLSKEAKAEWKRVIAALGELDMLKATDQAALEAYCDAYGNWLIARKIILAQGLMIQQPLQDKTGAIVGYKTVRHPASIVAQQERASMLKAASLFGFDPSSRSRVHLPEQPETTEDDLFDIYAAITPDDTRTIH